MSQSRKFRSESLLLIAALVWGFGFVGQRAAMSHLGPHAFNAIRFAVASLTLLPLALIDFRNSANVSLGVQAHPRFVSSGVLAGVVLFLSLALQQMGMVHVTAGKAAFITGLYVVLVPLLGLFVQQLPSFGNWCGAVLATFGLFLISVKEGFTFAQGDLVIFCAALAGAVHVILTGIYGALFRPFKFAWIQFVICSVISAVCALLLEETSTAAVLASWLPILYTGTVSVGLGYTLQVLGQRSTPASHAAVILSLESVVAAFAGWLILGETFSARGVAGCALMLGGLIVSQLCGRRVARSGAKSICAV